MPLTQVPSTMLNPTLPTVQRLTSTGTTVGYLFTANASVNVVQGETYTTPNAASFTVAATLNGTNLVWMIGTSAPNAATNTLTRGTGTGASTITYTAFQTLATYTAPANVKYLKIRMAGGGGGGGGSGGTSNSSNGGSGTAGTLSAFGSSVLIANGGGAGLSGGTNLQGGAGGTVTVNSPAINIASQQGGEGEGQGAAINAGYNRDPGADGGDTPFFGGGGKRSGSDSAGSAGLTNTGGGGQSGGYGSQGGLWIGSGGGSGGYVEAVISNPSSTYLYCVGSGGSGGTAGSFGYVGGVGGSGVIIVEEYYQ